VTQPLSRRLSGQVPQAPRASRHADTLVTSKQSAPPPHKISNQSESRVKPRGVDMNRDEF
jgi:hypothetical protein